jgi:hypothetical protein
VKGNFLQFTIQLFIPDRFMTSWTTNVILVAVAILAVAKANPVCEEECVKKFQPGTVLDACNRGCRLFNIDKGAKRLTDSPEDVKKTIDLCLHSCGDAYESDKTEDKAKKISACQSGCSQQRSVPEITLAPAAPKSLLDLLMGGNNMFEDDSHRKGGLTVSFGVPRMIQTSNLDDGFEVPSWVHQQMSGMMQQMHSNMKNMMERMKNGMPTMVGGRPDGLMTSGGKMVMIQAGPGYREEKTYNIGPSGKMTLIKNDMMGHHNPLEQIFDNKDVEIFDPKEAFQKSTTEEEREDFIAPILREIDNSIAHQAANDHASVYGNDFVEGPRLPETGLRSRPYHHIRDICLMDSHKM